jgi:ferric-dicitrate binding protein FerR (iron transport regulator)
MKNDDQEAVDLLRQMGRLAIPLLTPEREARRHERMASSVNVLLQRLSAEPPPRRWPVRALGAVAAIAAAAGLWVGVRQLMPAPRASARVMAEEVAHVVSVTGDATLVRIGSPPSAVVGNEPVSATDELRSGAGGRLSLALTGAGKAKVEVAESTRLTLNQHAVPAATESEDWVELEQGLVTLQVEKLAPGLGFSVQTPDARVTVHGTRFTVQVSPRAPSGTVTSVAVSEGRVEVTSPGHDVFLGPGEHWSSQSPAPEAETPPAALNGRAASRIEPARPSVSSSARALPPSRSAPLAGSTLADENRLYARALTHAGSGDLASALAELSTLTQRYPRSPLAQNARVERFRLLQQSGNSSGAAQEARRYLSEFPNGFARAEARSLALSGLNTAE